jgi:hypothetical protein
MRALFLFVVLAVLSGCATFKPQKGGQVKTSLSPTGTSAEATQPENPADKAEQATSRTEKRETPVSMPTAQITETKAPDGTVTTTRVEFSSVTAKEEVSQTASATVGAAQKDTARELAAKLAAMRPIQFAGIACLVFAAAGLFYAPLRIILGGGKQFPIAIGLLGAGLVVAPQLIAGNETLILIGAAVAAFVYWMSIRLTRKEAEADLLKKP